MTEKERRGGGTIVARVERGPARIPVARGRSGERVVEVGGRSVGGRWEVRKLGKGGKEAGRESESGVLRGQWWRVREGHLI